MRLKNKIALVTGSSGGIGVGIAKAMAADGADVIVTYCINENGAKKTARAITEMGRKALIVRADVGVLNDVQRLFDEIKETFGRLDVLVNNAGITPKKPWDEMEEEDWDRVLTINLKSVFLCCRAGAPIIPAGGAILNISSIHAHLTTYNFSAYAASKGGMEALTRSLAVELAGKGIRVNALRVGWIVVEREPFGPDDPSYEAVCARIPVGRVGQVEDVGPTAVHLCCDDSSFITGAVLAVDGGAEIMINSPFPKGFVEDGARKE